MGNNIALWSKSKKLLCILDTKFKKTQFADTLRQTLPYIVVIGLIPVLISLWCVRMIIKKAASL